MKFGNWQFTLQAAAQDLSQESYVGLVPNADGQQVLHLPIGYGAAPERAHQYLGDITRAIAHFCDQFTQQRTSSQQRDGHLHQADGLAFKPEGKLNLDISRIHTCLQLMRHLQEPELLCITHLPALAPQFNERHISRSLEHAHFLQDGTPLFDLMWAEPKRLQHNDSSGIVSLAAWIALDLLEHLFPVEAGRALTPSLRAEWERLAQRFEVEADLEAQASLFTDRARHTLAILQEALEAVRKKTPPFLTQAMELSVLLDSYLNESLGAGGQIGGLRGFHHVWEAGCLAFARTVYRDADIFTCDHQFLATVPPGTRARWQANQERVFGHNGRARRPDLVVEDENGLLIIDFKYAMSFSENSAFFLRRPSPPSLEKMPASQQQQYTLMQQWKSCQDIDNLESYRWLLMQHQLGTQDEDKVRMELWVPSNIADHRQVCWNAVSRDGRGIADSGFAHLSVRYQPTADILNTFSSGFRLF